MGYQIGSIPCSPGEKPRDSGIHRPAIVKKKRINLYSIRVMGRRCFTLMKAFFYRERNTIIRLKIIKLSLYIFLIKIVLLFQFEFKTCIMAGYLKFMFLVIRMVTIEKIIAGLLLMVTITSFASASNVCIFCPDQEIDDGYTLPSWDEWHNKATNQVPSAPAWDELHEEKMTDVPSSLAWDDWHKKTTSRIPSYHSWDELHQNMVNRSRTSPSWDDWHTRTKSKFPAIPSWDDWSKRTTM
jgi:hypothetical protein